jgi:RND family efflux transporter MFP subunit
MTARWFAGLLAITALGFTPGCGNAGNAGTGGAAGGTRGQAPPSAPVDVTLVPIRRLDAVRTVVVTGSLYGDIESTIAAKVAGRILRLHADLGDEIASGERLAELETRDQELELAEREQAVRATLAQLGLDRLPGGDSDARGFDVEALPGVRQRRSETENARARFERAEKLFRATPPLIAEQDLADLRTTWEMARDATEVEILEARALLAKASFEQAAVETARQRIVDATILAPLGERGEPRTFRVAERLVSVGELMSIGTPTFVLVAVDPIRYRAQVPERFVGRIALDQRVQLLEEENAVAATGSVRRIAPRVDERSRSFEVEVVIPNPEGRLKPGAFARAAIEVATEPHVAFVPRSAIVTFAGVHRVFLVRDGKAVALRVQLGQATRVEEEDLVEIIGDLSRDEHVVDRPGGLRADAPVTVRGG